jgi:hypothetical protein
MRPHSSRHIWAPYSVWALPLGPYLAHNNLVIKAQVNITNSQLTCNHMHIVQSHAQQT